MALLRSTMALFNWQRVVGFLLLLRFIDIVSTQSAQPGPCPYNATGVVPPLQNVPEWNYLGCYPDNANDRLFNDTMYWGPENNTVTGCADFCRGSAFFGVEYSAQCFCGVRMAANTKPTSDGSCNYTCCADRTVSCGGLNRINVYEAVEPSPSQFVTMTRVSPTQASSSDSGEQSDGVGHGNENSKESNNIALGVGIGIPVPALIIAALTFAIKYRRRR